MRNRKRNNGATVLIPILAVVLILAVGATVIFLNSDKHKIKKHIAVADEYLTADNYERAISEYEAVLKIDRKNVDAYLGIANAYKALAKEAEKNDEYGDAREYYEEALEILEDGYDITDEGALKKAIEKIDDKLKAPAAAPAAAEEAVAVEEAAAPAATEEAAPAEEAAPTEEAAVEEADQVYDYSWIDIVENEFERGSMLGTYYEIVYVNNDNIPEIVTRNSKYQIMDIGTIVMDGILEVTR